MSRYDIILNPGRPAFFDPISRGFLDFSKTEVSSWEDFYDQIGFEGLLNWMGDTNVHSHRISGHIDNSTIRVAIDVIKEDGNRIVQLFLPPTMRRKTFSRDDGSGYRFQIIYKNSLPEGIGILFPEWIKLTSSCPVIIQFKG